ncbi:MAG TPA: hypothetical protein PK781_03085 [Terrimesophilobacter sp.]|nr:hypothetical protein [Terrimesophilobacter sp.]HRP99430.1 hypothetical protein [Terrimesophilobacter sp.]
MGILVYGHGVEHRIDDRVLAHLQLVIATKLRRDEPFLLSWHTGTDEGSGRVSLWMSPAIPLQFVFFGSRQPQLNRAWLDVLTELAFTPRGLLVISETDAEAVKSGELAIDDAPGMVL